MTAPAHAILYDADCGFCRWSLGWVLRWDRARRLRPVGLQDREAGRLLAGLDESARPASWHLVDEGGEVRSAGPALASLFALLPGGAAPAWLARRLPTATDRAYRWVARNRGSLGRPLGAGAVARADRLIAERA